MPHSIAGVIDATLIFQRCLEVWCGPNDTTVLKIFAAQCGQYFRPYGIGKVGFCATKQEIMTVAVGLSTVIRRDGVEKQTSGGIAVLDIEGYRAREGKTPATHTIQSVEENLVVGLEGESRVGLVVILIAKDGALAVIEANRQRSLEIGESPTGVICQMPCQSGYATCMESKALG